MAITVRDIAVDDLPALMPLWEEIQTDNAGLDFSVLLGLPFITTSSSTVTSASKMLQAKSIQ